MISLDKVSVNFSFDTETKTWKIIAEMNVARAKYSVTDFFKDFCVMGGTLGDQTVTSVELYDPEANEWTLLAHMEKPTSHFQLINLNGCLYALGGNAIEKYDSLGKCWMKVRNSLS